MCTRNSSLSERLSRVPPLRDPDMAAVLILLGVVSSSPGKVTELRGVVVVADCCVDGSGSTRERSQSSVWELFESRETEENDKLTPSVMGATDKERRLLLYRYSTWPEAWGRV